MEVETTIMPARTRLHELKSSADFPSEEFNHSIKTWVNMASLLVKQGNMAESTQDDENAYISYVRACLIVTKIIPHQAHYPSMMNDIVCIDLRQKILGIVSRMGHLERRLLKRFEQENQQRLAGARSSLSTVSSPTSTVAGSPTSCSSSSTLTLNCIPESKVDRALESEQDVELDTSIRMTSFKQGGDDDDDEEGNEAYEEEIAQDFIEMKYEFPAGDELVLELDPQVYVNHHRGTLTGSVGSRSVSPSEPQQQQSYNDSSSSDKGVVPTLKKKSSNDDERSSLLLSPECQPNFSATMPSALFARQREGCHVRRCSSTDAITTSVHFPSIMALATAAANEASPSSRFSVCEPTAPRRADKRCSMIVMGGSDIGRVGTKDKVPDYRGTASSINEGEEEKAQYARDILKSRFTNRRTMSFESNYFHTTNGNSPFEALPKIAATQLRKSNSISRLGSYSRTPKDVPPTPRLSVQNINLDGASSTAPMNTQMSLSSGSINQSVLSSTSSTPFTSPLLRSTGPHMPSSAFVVHGGHGQGHGHSYSLTSIASGSTIANADPFLSLTSNSQSTSNTSPKSQQQQLQDRILHRQSSSISCSTTSTVTATSSATTVSSASSPTLISMATWATVTTGKKVGLLRKIRSKPKVKDQLFDIVASPTPTPSPSPHLLQQQQQQQQQQMLMSLVTGHARQQSGPNQVVV
ncbi:hypothetical protein BGX26_008753 [Mortierella sp. AD094]|nr:hypothetical protein BGX26_008753 [Mortierella sp. AD094]